MNNKDILGLIALHISDFDTWYAFALICKNSAHAVRNITNKRSQNYNYTRNRKTEFFIMSLDPPPPPPPSRFECIVIGSASSGLCGTYPGYNPYGVTIESNGFNLMYGNGSINQQFTGSYLWSYDNPQFDINGNKTWSVYAKGRGGEGIRFNNGSERDITSKRYNNSTTWSYAPKNPEHWGGFAPPTSLAEACDRLAEQLFKIGGPVP